jgi:predicted DNA-binding transcriptional regulator AlpA
MNMSQISTSQPAAYPQYFGAHPKTCHQRFLTVEGKKLNLNGTAYKLVPRADGNGEPKLKRSKISTTPGYVPNPSLDVSFIALCSKTNERIRLVGQIIPVANKPVGHNSSISGEAVRSVHIADVEPVNQSICMPQVEDVATASEYDKEATSPMDAEHSAAKKMARVQRLLAVFKREIEIVMAQSLAGIDPPVSIATTGFMSKRSHAAMYRDIKKKVLPQPTKIGRSSMFPYSIVKAYAAGQLVGVGA